MRQRYSYKDMKKVVSVVVFALMLPSMVFAYVSPGKPTGLVNDFAHMLSADQKNVLERKLELFQQSSTNELSVVTIETLGEDSIEDYASALFKEWKIGTKKNDNGVLLLIALDDRKMRIEVGYGLEGALTDAISSDIIRNTLTPAFRSGDYYGGIDAAIDNIIAVTKGEYVSQGSSQTQGGNGLLASVRAYGFFIIFGCLWMSSILARSRSWWAGGVVGGVVAVIFGVVYTSLATTGILAAILVPLGLLFDYIVSKKFAQHKGSNIRPPWWIGGGHIGGGWGGGTSSGGFGGFSGGSSGGGGASGGW